VEGKSAKNRQRDYTERKASPSHSLFLLQEKKEGEEGGCLRRSEEKSNTHLSLNFSFKGSLFNRRRALRPRQRCERAQRASKTRMPASRIGGCILPILESGILVSV